MKNFGVYSIHVFNIGGNYMTDTDVIKYMNRRINNLMAYIEELETENSKLHKIVDNLNKDRYRFMDNTKNRMQGDIKDVTTVITYYS